MSMGKDSGSHPVTQGVPAVRRRPRRFGTGSPIFFDTFPLFHLYFRGGKGLSIHPDVNLVPDSYEFQMLYGVRPSLPDEIVRRGLIRKQPAESAESFDLTCG